MPVVVAGDARAWSKEATGAIAVARLERIANILARAQHPGVVELIGYSSTGLESAQLQTVWIEGPTLGECRLPLEEVAGVVAAVAATLADLHDRDVAHGAVAPDHILVPPGTGPRLCGFSGDPAASATDDVAALGHLLAAAVMAPQTPDRLDALRAAVPSLPTRQRLGQLWARTRRRPTERSWGGEDVRRAIEDIARTATDEEPDRRPSARTIANLLHDRVPGVRLPGSEGRAPQSRVATTHRVLLIGTPLGLLAAGLIASSAVGPAAVEVAPAPSRGQAPTTRVTDDGTSREERDGVQLWPVDERSCPPPRTPLRGDVDHDGCEESLAFRDGVLISDDTQLAVGAADDIAVTGDWDCDGSATLVLLRPTSGTVWHFPSWPAKHEAVTADLVTTQPDVVVMRARRDSSCDHLELGRADGSTATIEVHRGVGT